MKRIVLGIEYDGSNWLGWQTQLNGVTVQDALQHALYRFTQTDITVYCAGRTDKGVHALEQVVHFDTDLDRDLHSWVSGINTFLPSSIVVLWSYVVRDDLAQDFHARFSATARTYQYVVHNNPIRSSILHGKVGWVFRPLDVALMRDAAGCLLGAHDFSAFRAAQCQALSSVKTMHEVKIVQRGDLIIFTFCANAFLYHMVRNIVGSLIFVGMGKNPPGWMGELLLCGDRKIAAPTFAPDGLYLTKINYDQKWALPQSGARYPFIFGVADE